MMKRYLTTMIAMVFSVITVFSVNLYAENAKHDHDEHRSHDAHVHGIAELTLAQEGQLLEIEFHSPAANIVGFEHKASTEKQKQMVETAKATLENPRQLFIFNGTRCDIKKTRVDVSALLDHHHDEHDKHAKDDHQEPHSEITAHYQFSCQQSTKLTSVSVELLEKFTGIKKLEIQWVADSKQGADTLNHNAKIIHLR